MERKNAKTRRETSVQGTNDSSIVSKCSTASCGYFQDPFLHLFVSKKSRRAPLIHRGYYIRAKAFDLVLQRFLRLNTGYKNQIISLGCGFDSTYFRLKDLQLLTDTTFFEIDFPDLVKRKCTLIENTDILLNFIEKNVEQPLSPHIEMSCKDYHLLGVDLTQLNTLEAALKMCGIDFEAPTLLFSECVMTYMTRRCSTDLVKWAAETFENAAFGMYEQINPDDAFGLFMQNHFHSIGSPLKCINAFPTLDSQRERFLKAGWTSCDVVDMNTFFHQCLPDAEQERIETLEAFDEYEELNLKYSHYFILMASTLASPLSLIAVEKQLNRYISVPVISDVISLERFSAKESVRRFGHSSCVVNGGFILTTGGFGEIDGRHQRLTEITVTSMQSLVSHHIPCVTTDDVHYSRMHHASVALSDGAIYLLAGRQSPYFLCSQMLKITPNFHENVESCSNIIIPFQTENVHKVSDSLSKEADSDTSDRKGIPSCQSTETYKEYCEDEEAMPKAWSQLLNVTDFDVASKGECINNGKLSNCAVGSDCNSDMPKTVKNGSVSVKTWTCPFGHINVELVHQTGSLPCNRWRHAATKVIVDGKEKLFLHGGKTKNGQILRDAFLFDPSTNQWTILICTGDSPGAQHSHGAVFWKGQVVLTGGLDDRQVPTADIFLLNLSSMVWTRLDITGRLSARYSHCSEIISDKLLLIGGVNLSHPPPGVAVINLLSKRALEFALPSQDKSSLLMLHRHTTAVLDSEHILVLGGGGNCFSFGTHLNRTPVVINVGPALDTVN